MNRNKFIYLLFCFMLFIFGDSILSNAETINLIKNSSFEESTNGFPNNWQYIGDKLENNAIAKVVSAEAYTGKRCLKITNVEPNDSMIIQNVNVEQGKNYKIICWIKTENIKNLPGSANVTLFYGTNGTKGCKGIITSKELYDTKGVWEKLEFDFESLTDVEEKLSVGIRLGGQGTQNQGSAYFDDISLIRIDEANSTEAAINFYVPDEGNSDSTNSGNTNTNSSPFNTKLILLVGISVILLAGLLVAEAKLSNKARLKARDNNEYVEEDAENEEEDDEDEE